MAKVESTIRQISAPQQRVYDKLSNLKNAEGLTDKIPQDKVHDLEFGEDSISVTTQLGRVSLSIVDREEPKMIKFATKESPLPFNFWVQILPVDEQTSKMKLTIDADINAFMFSMVKGQLQTAIEKLADVLQAIEY